MAIYLGTNKLNALFNRDNPSEWNEFFQLAMNI